MKYVGIDPSLTATAMVAINEDGEPASIINNIGYELPKDSSVWRLAERTGIIADGISAFLKQHDLKAAAIEGYSFSSGGSSLFQIGEMIGVVRYKIMQAGKLINHLPVTIPPTALKKFATGRGNADKSLMVLAASKDPWNFEYMNKGNPDDNVIDAFWLAQMMRYSDKSIRGNLPALSKEKMEPLYTLGLWKE